MMDRATHNGGVSTPLGASFELKISLVGILTYLLLVVKSDISILYKSN